MTPYSSITTTRYQNQTAASAASTVSNDGKKLLIDNCFTQLPDGPMRCIAECLSAKELVQLGTTSKTLMYDSLSLSCLPPIRLIKQVTWSGDVRSGDTPHKHIPIPVLFRNRIHSVVVSLDWNDQGWGNRKGQIYIIASSSKNDKRDNENMTDSLLHQQQVAELINPPSPPSQDPFKGGSVVYQSPIAGHETQSLRFSFSPKKDDTNYHLWYQVGGGGGHTLTLKNVQMQLLLQMDYGQHVKRNFVALVSHKEGLLESFPSDKINIFGVKLLMQVAQSLLLQLTNEEKEEKRKRQQQQTHHHHHHHPSNTATIAESSTISDSSLLSTFLTTHGIQANSVPSLLALMEIGNTILEHEPLLRELECHNTHGNHNDFWGRRRHWDEYDNEEEEDDDHDNIMDEHGGDDNYLLGNNLYDDDDDDNHDMEIDENIAYNNNDISRERTFLRFLNHLINFTLMKRGRR